jgi:hypothetical protein
MKKFGVCEFRNVSKYCGAYQESNYVSVETI